MKASKASVGRSVDQPDPRVCFYLFYGPDESQARALGSRVVAALGASKLALSADVIKTNPGLLAAEASAMSLFGEKRAIWIEPAGDDIAEGVETLFQSPVESPTIAIGGALRKTSALVKLAEASPLAVAYAAYLPEGQDAQRMVVDLGRTLGLKISAPVAARIADSCAGDQAIVSQELRKLALYVDASPHTPRELDHEAVDAVGADTNEGDFLKLADLALRGGAMEALGEELARLPAAGTEAIPVVRSLQRRLLMLAPIRARVERGERVDAVMTSAGRSLFWKDKPLVEAMLKRWTAEDLAKAADRAGLLERELMFSTAPQREALGEELIAIARKARRR